MTSFYKSSASWPGFIFFIVVTFQPSQGSSVPCSCQLTAAYSAADGKGVGPFQPKGRRCCKPPRAAGAALLLAREAQRGKGRGGWTSPAALHEAAVMHRKSSDVKAADVLWWKRRPLCIGDLNLLHALNPLPSYRQHPEQIKNWTGVMQSQSWGTRKKQASFSDLLGQPREVAAGYH